MDIPGLSHGRKNVFFSYYKSKESVDGTIDSFRRYGLRIGAKGIGVGRRVSGPWELSAR